MLPNTKKHLQLILVLLLGPLLLVGCGSSSNAPTPLGSVDIPVTLSGDFSVSAMTPNPAATGTGTLTLNLDTGALSGSIAISGHNMPVNNAHIHAGLAGIAGGVIVPLDYTTSVSDILVPAGTMLTSDQMTAFLNADHYVNVHTQANPAGELRGQIIPANYQVIRTELDGASVYPVPTIPPGVSTNTGVGYLTINTNTLSTRGNITSDGLAGDHLAYIHGPAAAGASAAAIVTFSKDLANDDEIWTLPDTQVVSQITMDYIVADQTYLNVHSLPDYGAGEIRGQIIP